MTRTSLLLLICLLGAAAPPAAPVTFTDYTQQFDEFEARTSDEPMDARVKAFRAEFERLAPGLYADPNQTRLDRRIADALRDFPSIRTSYRSVEVSFPGNLAAAVGSFRRHFPGFTPPMPIIFAHELGVRDGGSDYVAGRKVMLFGADVIARIHDDDSIQPFIEHELFHLEHARHFADCDQLWCPLWQEGLATYAASVMTPGASDHQLLLDQPMPIRAPTDARWGAALCWMADNFDSTSPNDADAAFSAGRRSPSFPPRFGYYVGLRVAAEATRGTGLAKLSRLSDSSARPVVVRALRRLITGSHAPCTGPKARASITHEASRPA